MPSDLFTLQYTFEFTCNSREFVLETLDIGTQVKVVPEAFCERIGPFTLHTCMRFLLATRRKIAKHESWCKLNHYGIENYLVPHLSSITWKDGLILVNWIPSSSVTTLGENNG